MSKLYTEYLNLKNSNPDIIYIFKSGIFYTALDKDAIKLSEEFGFKLVNLNESIVKCGFPENRLEFYTNLFSEHNINFKIIDLKYNKIENYSDYLNNIKLKNIINSLLELDMNNLTFKESFELLSSVNQDLKKIYNRS